MAASIRSGFTGGPPWPVSRSEIVTPHEVAEQQTRIVAALAVQELFEPRIGARDLVAPRMKPVRQVEAAARLERRVDEALRHRRHVFVVRPRHTLREEH